MSEQSLEVRLAQAEQERDEMERQMICFRDELEAAQFWNKVLPNGLNQEDIRRELKDFYFLMQEVGKVYYHITEGKVAMQATKSETVIEVYNEILQRKILEAEEKLLLVIDQHEVTIQGQKEIIKENECVLNLNRKEITELREQVRPCIYRWQLIDDEFLQKDIGEMYVFMISLDALKNYHSEKITLAHLKYNDRFNEKRLEYKIISGVKENYPNNDFRSIEAIKDVALISYLYLPNKPSFEECLFRLNIS